MRDEALAVRCNDELFHLRPELLYYRLREQHVLRQEVRRRVVSVRQVQGFFKALGSLCETHQQVVKFIIAKFDSALRF